MSTESAREAVLGRIRRAKVRGVEAAVADATNEAEMDAAWAALPRRYGRGGERSPAEVMELLEDRLRDYDAYVERVAEAGLALAVRRRLEARGWPAMLVPEGLPAAMLPEDGTFTVDTGFSPCELDAFEGVLTTATAAIALTGTLVLQDVAGQGRRAATLIPDYHLCVVRERDMVETVPEAMERLAGTARRPTTFVSGPSATADIEMTRIKGVHGPRVLDVVLVLAEESL